MSPIYPDWYDGGCPDIEAVLIDLFTPLLGGVNVVSWFPPDYASQMAGGTSYLRVFRMGGQINIDTKSWVDQTRVQVAALCLQRDDSWALIEFVRQVLYAYNQGGSIRRADATSTFVVVPGEVLGPQFIPEQLRDERLVPVTFEVHADRPKGLPSYRQALGLDS